MHKIQQYFIYFKFNPHYYHQFIIICFLFQSFFNKFVEKKISYNLYFYLKHY